jgi:tetratricopeptide (TPR) repeat protein
MLRGRRRDKLEARVVQAQGLVERGDWAAAEKIVTSALKLIPDHPMALDLFGKIRDLKLRPGTAEAEAEGELLLLARAQAQKAAEAARSALAAGWNRQAFFHVRRGLRQVPDHPELLALLHETQGSLEQIAAERARRRALVAQVRAGLELLAAGDFEGSLRILRAVLAEDPDNVRAQAAVQEVRRIWLEKGGVPPPVSRPQPAPAPMVAAPAVAQRPALQRATPTPATVPASIPGEILLPRTLRRATPVGVILLGAVALLGVVAVIIDRSSRAPVEPTPSATISPATAPSATAAAPTTTAPPGPLTEVDPALKTAVEATLSAYARALERADAALLAEARPDLTPRERDARRAPFVGALNAAADIRVIEAEAQGNEASITILSSYIIVDGHEAPSGPIEETLRFARRGGAWSLRDRRAGKP